MGVVEVPEGEIRVSSETVGKRGEKMTDLGKLETLKSSGQP